MALGIHMCRPIYDLMFSELLVNPPENIWILFETEVRVGALRKLCFNRAYI